MTHKTAWLTKISHWYLLPGEYLKPVSAWGHRLPIRTTDLNKILQLVPGAIPELVEVPVQIDEAGVTWYTLPLPNEYRPESQEVSYQYTSKLHADLCATRRAWYAERRDLRDQYWNLEPRNE